MPVDRMERVSGMPCNDSFFALMRSPDCDQNSPSNHLLQQQSVLFFLSVTLYLELVLWKRVQLVDLPHELVC